MKKCLLSHPGRSHTLKTFCIICVFVSSQRERSPGCPAPAPEQMRGGDPGAEARLLLKRAHETHCHVKRLTSVF